MPELRTACFGLPTFPFAVGRNERSAVPAELYYASVPELRTACFGLHAFPFVVGRNERSAVPAGIEQQPGPNFNA
jgi:hypothetical protein